MGMAVCDAVSAAPDLELVAVVDPVHNGRVIGPGGLVVGAAPETMKEAGAQVVVDFTVAAAAVANAAWCAANGVHAVIGTTGFTPGALDDMKRIFAASTANCIVAPNFAIGAVLMMRFAELAAPWFETVEVVELHHDAKLDSPSGTALLTAQRISAARAQHTQAGAAMQGMGQTQHDGTTAAGEDRAPARGLAGAPARGLEGAPGVQVHSVRLRGLVAHQEVLLGTAGQVLTLRHDSLDRCSFMPGVLLAVREVPLRRGFTLGLDSLLGL
jgi:4-hydroxy-tetrahydrodipicolinate reductase